MGIKWLQVKGWINIWYDLNKTSQLPLGYIWMLESHLIIALHFPHHVFLRRALYQFSPIENGT